MHNISPECILYYALGCRISAKTLKSMKIPQPRINCNCIYSPKAHCLDYIGSRVHTCRTDQNSLTFPWHKFKFPWQYWSQKFYNFSKEDTLGPKIPASSGWNVKFPDISLTFLQNFIFPWHITEFPDNSLTLKNLHFPDAYEPWVLQLSQNCLWVSTSTEQPPPLSSKKGPFPRVAVE